ncbi:tetratricopeptide repeat protein [Chthonobacter rhizosphaerae]|uniref:tetratricopeptide repeat protein n=1 Tax=Chthonobacter rhizosphaerae TaxID=2735553 RepID=UPI0015EE4ED6|nr:tetratricopeptide repeat protein [Chthonobacter rhizosphaerae]
MASTKIDTTVRSPGSRQTMRTTLVTVLAAAAISLLCGPAFAVFSGDMSPRAPSGDPEYAKGMAAWDKEDWPAVVFHMARVVANRPHHDNAWARLGFAHRKLKKYDASLAAYGRALEINKHNRAALEYLGEAYVELGRYVEAVEVLDRLGEECKRVEITFSDGAFGDGCQEFTALRTLIDLVGGDTSAVVDRWD